MEKKDLLLILDLLQTLPKSEKKTRAIAIVEAALGVEGLLIEGLRNAAAKVLLYTF